LKAGDLKINHEEVATKDYTDTTFAVKSNEDAASQLSTTTGDHGCRLTAIEGANYATISELSLYAAASSLGTTNTTVGGINTRVNTIENAGYITTPALQAHGYATTAALSDYALAATVTTNSTTLAGSVLPAIIALQAQVFQPPRPI